MMSELERLLDGAATPAEREILDALTKEAPSPELSARMAAHLDGALLAPGAAAAAKAGALSATAKGALVGVALLGGGLGLYLAVAGDGASEPAQPAAVAAAAPSAAVVRSAAASTTAASRANDDDATRPEALDERRARQRQERQAASPRAAPSGSTASTLAAELALIDAAKRALRQGAPGRASALLGDYRRQFPRGVLSQEASVLEVEVLVATGSRAAARRRVERFRAAYPRSPHLGQLERLIGASAAERE